jgi:hypothetical protein
LKRVENSFKPPHSQAQPNTRMQNDNDTGGLDEI